MHPLIDTEKDEGISKNFMHYPTTFHHAEAAPASRPSSATSTQETLLQDADILTSDASEDDAPPPPYGDTYGEIRNEKDGLGASARVSEDGRVNIRINQLNRRLSQIFTPSLRQQSQSAEDSQPPPPPYVPPSLSGEGRENGLPPPSLNVVIQVVGSRGDVQPFIALGKVLKDTYGHRVRLATHPVFKDFVLQNDLEFFSIGGDPSKLMAFMVKNPGLMPGIRSIIDGDVSERRRDVAEYIQGCWRSCYRAGDGMAELAQSGFSPRSEPLTTPFIADCIIANPPSFAHIHCAEKLGIPLHIMFTMPYSPTQAFPHPLANIQSSNADPQLTNYVSYAMIELLSWQGLSDIINKFRARCLGLDPVSLIRGPAVLQRLKIPHTYCWSPALIPKPKDWGHQISISGFFSLDSTYTPSPDLQAFLDDGPLPVYIGFGSIVLDDPHSLRNLVFEAVRKTGQRVLLSKGWGGIGVDEPGLTVPAGVFMLDNVPHDWLFKHVSCVVHHGGAGTTAAGITAGRPTVVVPFFGDQFFWGSMIARAGAGPDPIPHRHLTADRLAGAINFCLSDTGVLKRAKELGSEISQEQGSENGAQSFHRYLEPDRLRCMLAPSKAAVWRIKRTNIRLSAFAAYVLADENLLDFCDLKLFRAQEYEIDEGPWDPVSGGFAAACASFGGIVMGVADLPTETVKAFQRPFRSNRHQSHKSVPTIPGANTSDAEEKATWIPLSQRSASLNEPTTPAISTPSTPASTIAPIPKPNASQVDETNEGHKTNGIRALSRGGSTPAREYDMLRQSVMPSSSKGLARLVKTAFQVPMDVSMGLTKGFRNAPKHWGDDTVRPAIQVNDFLSGAKAAGQGLGFGVYDGFTGLVTQPWNGARKEGVTGFLKGFGKGIGGLAAKPGGAFIGVVGYTLKGVHKEVQKLIGSNVHDYIVGSRAVQGHQDWLQSSEAEREDVIERWKLIQKYLKKKGSAEESIRDVLEAQQKENVDGGPVQGSRHTVGFPRSVSLDAESAFTTTSIADSPEGSLWTVETIRPLSRELQQDVDAES